jgi:hypothetical protein
MERGSIHCQMGKRELENGTWARGLLGRIRIFDLSHYECQDVMKV